MPIPAVLALYPFFPTPPARLPRVRRLLRSVYRRLPAERRSQGEWVLSWLVQAGVLHALIALLVSILLLDMGRQRWHGRRRDNRAAAGVNGHGTSGVEARKAAGAEEGVER